MEDVRRTTGEDLTESQIEDLKATFKNMDMDQDGKISIADLKKACRHLGIILTTKQLKDMMTEADINCNGFIEYREYERLVGPRLVIANYRNKQLREAFGNFDKNGDGYITEAELRETLRQSGVEMDDDEIKQLMNEADTNKDGVICFEEFVNTVCEKDW